MFRLYGGFSSAKMLLRHDKRQIQKLQNYSAGLSYVVELRIYYRNAAMISAERSACSSARVPIGMRGLSVLNACFLVNIQ